MILHVTCPVVAQKLDGGEDRDRDTKRSAATDEHCKHRYYMRGKETDGRDEKYSGKMHHDGAKKGARCRRALFRQKTGAQRYSDEQECNERRAGSADQ